MVHVHVLKEKEIMQFFFRIIIPESPDVYNPQMK